MQVQGWSSGARFTGQGGFIVYFLKDVGHIMCLRADLQGTGSIEREMRVDLLGSTCVSRSGLREREREKREKREREIGRECHFPCDIVSCDCRVLIRLIGKRGVAMQHFPAPSGPFHFPPLTQAIRPYPSASRGISPAAKLTNLYRGGGTFRAP